MAALCVASQCATSPSSSSLPLHTSSSSASSLRDAALGGGAPALRFALHAGAATQAKNGRLMVRASSSEEAKCSRRNVVVAGGSTALAGLLLVLPAAEPAEARTINPGVRRKLREAIDKVKEEAGKGAKETKKTVEEGVKQVQAAGEKLAAK